MGKPPFPVNPHRIDPYKNFKFRVQWDGHYVAGVSKISMLKRTTEVIKHRHGGDLSTFVKSPGRTDYDPVTLERGVTQDTAFQKWVSKCWHYGAALGKEVSLKDFRKHINIHVLNEAGQTVLGYKLYRCWVSEFHAIGDLDANTNAILIQSIKIENEGWEIDKAIKEKPEPSFG